MLLMLAIFLMVATQSYNLASNRRHALRTRTRRNSQGLRGLPAWGLGLAIGLMSLTSGAWAHASAGGNDARSSRPTSVRSGENVASTAAPSLNIGPTSDAEGYAAREAKSKDLENFKGGATTVVIGSSALVIIIVVVLILILI